MIIYGHRGASGYAPENTLAAFQEAARRGADGIELDVQLTRDGEVVVIHDHKIDRTSNGHGWIKDFTLTELKHYDFGGWFSSDFIDEAIPTLNEVLDWLQSNQLQLNIEIKNGPVVYSGIEEKIVNLLAKYHLEQRTIVSSFHHPCLKQIKHYNPKISTGALFECRPISVPLLAQNCGAEYLHPNWQSLDAEWVSSAKTAGLTINAYTLNHYDEYQWIKSLDINGIFTNFPDSAAHWIHQN